MADVDTMPLEIVDERLRQVVPDAAESLRDACFLIVGGRKRGRLYMEYATGVFAWAEDIVAGLLHPQVVLMLGDLDIVRRVRGYPLDEQLRLIDGGTFVVARRMSTDQSPYPANVPWTKMSRDELRRVFGSGEIRTYESQLALFPPAAPREPVVLNKPRYRVDMEGRRLFINNEELPLADLINFVGLFGYNVVLRSEVEEIRSAA